MEITPRTMIADIVRNYPASAEILKKYRMACLSCMGLAGETLENGCMMHGLALDEVLADLKKMSR